MSKLGFCYIPKSNKIHFFFLSLTCLLCVCMSVAAYLSECVFNNDSRFYVSLMKCALRLLAEPCMGRDQPPLRSSTHVFKEPMRAPVFVSFFPPSRKLALIS